MWNELKEAPLVWRLAAFVGIPIAAIFACVSVSGAGYLLLNRSINQPQAVTQDIIADVSPIPPSSETTLNLPPATETLPAATPTPSEVSYELNWKIEDGQPHAYNTAMEVSECCVTVDYDRIFNFDQLDEGEEGNDAPSPFEQMFEDLKNNQPAYSLVSILEKKPDGNISVKMVLDNVDVPEQESEDSMGQWYGQMLQGMVGTVQLQGDITPDGEIASPYMAQQQKNLIALFFELPVGPVKVGDTWQIDLTCIILNSAQFEIENSDRVNQVTLKEITETPEGETMAVLDYLIAESVEGKQTIPFFTNEPVPTSVKCSFLGRGEFLIEQGRWQSFSAENTLQSTGIVTSNVTQQLALTPLDEVPEYPEPALQDQPSLSDIFSRTQETKVCEYVSEAVIESNEGATLTISSYVPSANKFGVSDTSFVLQLANMETPEEISVNEESFSLNPYEKMATEKPTSVPLDPDPNRPPEPIIRLTLISIEEDIADTKRLKVNGSDYLLMLDDSPINESCRQ